MRGQKVYCSDSLHPLHLPSHIIEPSYGAQGWAVTRASEPPYIYYLLILFIYNFI